MSIRILTGDCIESMRALEDGSVQTCVTSPPYWGLRDYGVSGQIGLESTFTEYVDKLVAVFREVRRVLRDDGTLWLNLGDSYNAHPGQRKSTDAHGEKQGTNEGANRIGSRHCGGLKPKDLVGVPWRVAFALQADGWYLRQDIIWAKPNPMPESVRDRCTKAHEYMFLLAKRERYYFDADAIAEECTQDESRPTFRGGAYVNNATFDNMEGGQSTVVGNIRRQRKPAGLDTGEGAHGSIHRDGRAQEVEYTEATYGKRNRRSVWNIATSPFPEAHFATFPPALIEPCILAGSRVGDTVLDPFSGAGTTALVADRLQRHAVGCELNPEYVAMSVRRIERETPLFADVRA